VTRYTNINRGEPAHSLFEIRADYKVTEGADRNGRPSGSKQASFGPACLGMGRSHVIIQFSMDPTGPSVTALLEQWGRGNPRALEQLLPIIYDELRRLAASYLRGQRSDTLPPTALVHEVYLQLVEQHRIEFHNRSHFFGAAAQIIRRILVDRAREKGAAKRGGDAVRVALEDALAVSMPGDLDVMALDLALSDLAAFDAQKAKVVELRYFAGLSIPETAEALGVSPMTIKREWAIARAWLYERLTGAAPQA
jgi:RNA polymerase sigma factor (TIGR02999 family)